jgi:hypothetical protein
MHINKCDVGVGKGREVLKSFHVLYFYLSSFFFVSLRDARCVSRFSIAFFPSVFFFPNVYCLLHCRLNSLKRIFDSFEGKNGCRDSKILKDQRNFAAVLLELADEREISRTIAIFRSFSLLHIIRDFLQMWMKVEVVLRATGIV